MFFELFGISVSLYFIWTTWFKKRASDPPELSGRLPLIGHGYKFLGDSTELLESLRTIGEETHEKGGVTYIYMGPRKVYIVTDPKDNLTICNTCLNKDYIYNFTKIFLGNGLITSSETIWKRHRKLLNPAFSQIVLNGFITTFNSHARELVKHFAREVGKPFDHERPLRLVNLETICATAMGIDNEDQYRNLQEQYIPLIASFLDTVTERFKKFWLHSDFIFNLSSLKKKQQRVVQHLLELCDSILRTKKEEIHTSATLDSQENTSKTKPFLELMLGLTNETGCFSDDDIKDEVNSIVVAGHDTSASVLTFAFALLGSYPEVQEKVFKEVVDCFGNSDVCDKEALSKLVYTDAVLKETMRLYPVAQMIGRHLDKPVTLRNYTLEANHSCYLFLGAVSRHPMWGPDRHQFRPERWFETDTLPHHDYFVGFSMGRRSCIGKVYAMMSMKITVAHVIRQYKITSNVDNMVVKWDMMTRPKSGHYITVTTRN